ncbi:sulfotransferase family protein [Gracilimonas mengyeensis]|uniref:Sulfotransferase family protein n=1 Tax=Gracilimonas mengyeensis TaxID=1302730 RepID=A0A521EGR7_9BACT|nr:sulfotransferase [Gracilimonas mengyeensis]SMO83127.1 Sulfotransferase family protein [Gracilimonas mengyeensis]
MTLLEILKSFYEANKEHYELLKKQSNVAHLEHLEASEIYSKVHSKAGPVFVLSTGRCGTKLLTQILTENKQLEVHHEPYPTFTWHCKYAFENHANKPETVRMMFDVARYELIRDAYLNKKTYVETNNRITFFAHQLAELYPHARFVHLIREPVSFVKSGLSRNWYSGKEIYDEGRITDTENPDTWGSYSQAEKIAWLWKATNSFIEDFKKEQEVFTLYSRQLFSDPTAVNELLEFLELPHLTSTTLQKHQATPVNKNKKDLTLSDPQIQSIKDITET